MSGKRIRTSEVVPCAVPSRPPPSAAAAAPADRFLAGAVAGVDGDRAPVADGPLPTLSACRLVMGVSHGSW